MPQVAANADDYAVARVNIFFPGVIPELDGQCVSLAKWFMQEMSDVPNPQAARGDARYVGKTLVAQGHAVEVPYAQRKRGDIICYEYGQYGHIAVQLGGGNVFEQNVNWSGVSSETVDGAKVYASRIGSENESWRHDVHIYRLKSYNETNGGGNVDDLTEAQYDALARAVLTLGMFMVVEGNDSPDRQPTLTEITDAIDRLKNDPVDYVRGLTQTSPWSRNWLHVKYYDKDVAAASGDDVTPYSGEQLFVKNKEN